MLLLLLRAFKYSQRNSEFALENCVPNKGEVISMPAIEEDMRLGSQRFKDISPKLNTQQESRLG